MSNPQNSIGKLISMMKAITGHDYSSLSDLGLIENEQILVLVYQSLLNHTDNQYKVNL